MILTFRFLCLGESHLIPRNIQDGESFPSEEEVVTVWGDGHLLDAFDLDMKFLGFSLGEYLVDTLDCDSGRLLALELLDLPFRGGVRYLGHLDVEGVGYLVLEIADLGLDHVQHLLSFLFWVLDVFLVRGLVSGRGREVSSVLEVDPEGRTGLPFIVVDFISVGLLVVGLVVCFCLHPGLSLNHNLLFLLVVFAFLASEAV